MLSKSEYPVAGIVKGDYLIFDEVEGEVAFILQGTDYTTFEFTNREFKNVPNDSSVIVLR